MCVLFHIEHSDCITVQLPYSVNGRYADDFVCSKSPNLSATFVFFATIFLLIFYCSGMIIYHLMC